MTKFRLAVAAAVVALVGAVALPAMAGGNCTTQCNSNGTYCNTHCW